MNQDDNYNQCISEMQKLAIQTTGYDNSDLTILIYTYIYIFTAILTLLLGYYIYFRI